MIEQCTIRDIIPIMICQWSSHRVDIAVSLAKPSDEKTDYNFRFERFSGKPNFFSPRKKVMLILVCVFTPGLHWTEWTVGWLRMATASFSFAGLKLGVGAGGSAFLLGYPCYPFPTAIHESHPSLVMSLRAVPSRALDHGVWWGSVWRDAFRSRVSVQPPSLRSGPGDTF